MKIRNPILPGFNPDPSIWRVGEDYYIATSTFEWYPGVQIHHSRDLQNWTLVCRPLDRAEPARHARQSRFLRVSGHRVFPMPTACSGWSTPTSNATTATTRILTISSSRRRPSKVPGRTRSISTRPGSIHHCFTMRMGANGSSTCCGITMVTGNRTRAASRAFSAELSCRSLMMDNSALSVQSEIFSKAAVTAWSRDRISGKGTAGTNLITAEGGTGYDHAVTHARARTIEGPYEAHPNRHVLTTKDAPDSGLQRVGHGQPVETPDGQFFHTFLCSRPLPGTRRSPCGRETGIARLELRDDGWFYPAGNSPVPPVEFEADLPGALSVKTGTQDLSVRRSGIAPGFPVAPFTAAGSVVRVRRPTRFPAPLRT